MPTVDTESLTKHLSLARLIGAIALGLMAAGASMALTKQRLEQRLDGAVQREEFHDTVGSIRRDVNGALDAATAAAKQSTSVSCYLAKYPAGLCDDFAPNTKQAGRPR